MAVSHLAMKRPPRGTWQAPTANGLAAPGIKRRRFRQIGVAAGTPPRHTDSLSAPPIKPPRHAWAQWIGPETLISQVRGTAPFLEPRLPATEPGRLIELGHSPDGFLRILANWENILRPNLNPEEQLQDYFAFCLACHHTTVATFVPTDVDTKIRGIVWRE